MGCLKIKKCTLDPLQQKVLGANIANHEMVEAIADVVVGEYRAVLEDDSPMEEESTESD